MGFFDSYFNPFRNLYGKESEKHPHARTLRGGFLRKVKDTFRVLIGETARENSYHGLSYIGLLDYATLFIPYAIERIFFWCRETINYQNGEHTFDPRTGENYEWRKPSSFERFLAYGLYYPWFLVLHWVCNLILFNILRYLFAALVTGLASFMVIPAAELFSWVVDKIYARKEKIYQLNVNYVKKKGQTIPNENENNNNGERMTSIKMLGALLTENAVDLDSIQVKYQHALTRDMLDEKIIFEDLTKGHTDLSFDTTVCGFEGEYYKDLKNVVGRLYVFKEGIVFVNTFKILSNGQEGNTPVQAKRFVMNAEQYNQLSQSMDMKQELFSNPEKYCSSQLIFIGENNDKTIAYLQTDGQSLQANHEPIQALLELNVGGMSLNFDNDADQAFKKEFSEETSLSYR